VKRLIILAVVTLLLGATPAWAAADGEPVTLEDVARADQVRRDMARHLEDQTIRYEAALVRVDELQATLNEVVVALAINERDLVGAQNDADRVAREMYMAGGTDGLPLIFDAATFTEIPLRAVYMDRVAEQNHRVLDRLASLESSYEKQQQTLAEVLDEEQQRQVEIEEIAATIMESLAEADEEYNTILGRWEAQEAERLRLLEEERLRKEAEEAERQRQAELERQRAAEAAAAAAAAAAVAATSTTTTLPPPTTTTLPPSGGDGTTTTTTTIPLVLSTDGKTCPVDGPTTFTDTWGACRSGCTRSHKGVDMISPMDTRLVAVESGTIGRMSVSTLGGITIWLYGDSGDRYYYAHLNAWADGLYVGQHVAAGELVGFVGKTGNAQYTVPHLHWEFHPGGGAAVNPTPLARELCG
jgi:murein DD-endopeptidase MepM/ murein hydrolase activator NlpD